MKKLILSFGLLLTLSLNAAPLALATGFGFQDVLNNLQESVTEQSGEMQEGSLGEDYDPESGQGIDLPTFSGEDGEVEGANIIVTAIQKFLSFFKLIVAPVAVLAIVIMGVRMVAAGSENEEVMTKSKNFIRYALEGLMIIFVSDSLVSVFFGAEGEVFRGGEAGAQESGRQVSQLFQGIYSLVEVVIASIAVFVLVMAGMRYVAGSASEDQIGKAKKQITWALVGLFVIGIAEFVAKDVIFQNQGTSLGVDEAKTLFANITNFVAGTIGTLSFLFFFYAGYLYSLGAQNEENIAKAKKIIIGAVLGIMLALAAFAFTNTLVDLAAS